MLKIRNFAETGGARPAMARMIRELPGLDYDICDLPLVNYISAKEHGAKFTALPVVLTRRFQHGGIWGDERQGIREPKDLEGKRVGLGYHGHTDLTWVRGIMSDVYGVDLNSITWITSDPEGVPRAKLPSECVADSGLLLPGARRERRDRRRRAAVQPALRRSGRPPARDRPARGGAGVVQDDRCLSRSSTPWS